EVARSAAEVKLLAHVPFGCGGMEVNDLLAIGAPEWMTIHRTIVRQFLVIPPNVETDLAGFVTPEHHRVTRARDHRLDEVAGGTTPAQHGGVRAGRSELNRVNLTVRLVQWLPGA